MKRNNYFGLGIALLLLGVLVLFFWPKQDSSNSHAQEPRLKSRPQSERLPIDSGDDRRESKRALQERRWLHAKEQPLGDGQAEPLESPVFLGYLQSDPTHTKLRIGLRQETNGQVDANDLVVKVDLFDAAGNPVAEGNKVSSEWKTEEESFGEIAAPVLMVNSAEVISEVRLTLVYKDKEVEIRRYALADR